MSSRTKGKERLTGNLVVVACLLLFFYLTLNTSLAKAPTTDEPLHFTRAVALRQAGDLTLQGEHAPFSHRLAGLLLFGKEQLPELQQLSTWSSGDRRQIASELLWESGIDVERTMFLARLPIIWLGILMGAFIASWALSWHGNLAVAVALILFATSPNLIANSALATTDLAAAATYFAAVYAWWLYWQQRKLKWWLLTAVLLGLALATKLTAILLLPVLFLLTLLYMGRGRNFWRPISIWLALLLPALVVLWLVYGAEVGSFNNWPIALPVPSYLGSWRSVLSHVDSGHHSFFLGELSKAGWRTYFPVTFLIKTPLVLLLLLLIALMVIIHQRELWRTALFLLVPVGALFAAAIASNLNIGYRHILPVLPFLLVFGSTAVIFLRRWKLTRVFLVLGLAWAVISAVRQNPHHLAYFNEAVGGTASGYRYLGDSNLDWGQDLNLLVETMTTQDGKWYVSYHGQNDPAYYGLPEETLIDIEHAQETFSAANPPPGQYAISANHLQGQLPDADLFDWFWRQQPSYHLGGSIQVYDVMEQAHGQWIAQCLDPTPLLTVEEAEILLGSSGIRHLAFDCRQSLLLADGGLPGWFILPQADSWWFQEQIPAVQTQLQLIYRHDAVAGLPSFDVYYWPGLDGASLTEGWVQTAEIGDGSLVSLPQALNDTAQITSYQVSGDQWLVQWVVSSAAMEPFTLLAHLYTATTDPPHVGDGLGFSSDQWQAGDWLVQRYIFPGQEEGLFLQTGMYNYRTLEIVGETIKLPVE